MGDGLNPAFKDCIGSGIHLLEWRVAAGATKYRLRDEGDSQDREDYAPVPPVVSTHFRVSLSRPESIDFAEVLSASC